jgi:hypothetical protein
MPTPTLKPTLPATNGHARPTPDRDARREEFRVHREALAGDYIEISARVLKDLSKFVAKAQDPGVRAGRADVLCRILNFQQEAL